tara:strand:+ start:540 stop:1052 length:513 start_codon:yes stop_codon:yes gene_type:complete
MNIKLITILAFLSISLTSVSQTYKIGYVKVERVFSEWPETKKANKELQEYEAKLSSRLNANVENFKMKVAAFTQNTSNMDDATKKDREAELKNLQTQINQFEANTVQSIKDKSLELLLPLQQMLKKAIEAVSRENGYTHIFDNVSFVFTTDSSGDISNKVATKLGFTLSD